MGLDCGFMEGKAYDSDDISWWRRREDVVNYVGDATGVGSIGNGQVVPVTIEQVLVLRDKLTTSYLSKEYDVEEAKDYQIDMKDVADVVIWFTITKKKYVYFYADW